MATSLSLKLRAQALTWSRRSLPRGCRIAKVSASRYLAIVYRPKNYRPNSSRRCTRPASRGSGQYWCNMAVERNAVGLDNDAHELQGISDVAVQTPWPVLITLKPAGQFDLLRLFPCRQVKHSRKLGSSARPFPRKVPHLRGLCSPQVPF